MTNTINITVSMSNEPSTECIPSGNMTEHNTTELLFNLDSTFTDEYKYYLEFVTPEGKIFRTDYLSVNSTDNSISYLLPASISKFGCADCYFNAVKIDSNGVTTQLIKPKTITLLFSALYDANGELLEEYDFSVNTLLEDIKNGSFKGDKGDSGANGIDGKDGKDYVLTSSDKTEIAGQINGEFYGLPLKREVSGSDSITVSDSLSLPLQKLTVSGLTSITKPNSANDNSVDNIAAISGVGNVTLTSNGNESQVSFESDLYALNGYADTADILNGIVQRNVAKYSFTGNENIINASTYTSGDVTINRFYWMPPVGSEMVVGSKLPGICTHCEEVFAYISSSTVLGNMIATGRRYIGIWFGQGNNSVYFFSDLSYEDFIAMLKGQNTAGTPVSIYYPSLDTKVTQFTKAAVSSYSPETVFTFSPANVPVSLSYCADISTVIKNLESK